MGNDGAFDSPAASAKRRSRELLQACAGGGDVQRDLSDLVSADAAGLETRRRVEQRGDTLRRVPGYIQLKPGSTRGGAGSDDQDRG